MAGAALMYQKMMQLFLNCTHALKHCKSSGKELLPAAPALFTTLYVCGLAASISAKVAVVNPDDVADCQIPYRLSPEPAYVTYGHVLLLISEGTWMRVPSWTKPCTKSTCNHANGQSMSVTLHCFQVEEHEPFNHKSDETYVHRDDRMYICRWSWLQIWNLSAESAFSAP